MASSSRSSERRHARAAGLGLTAAQPRADAERLAVALEALWTAIIGPLRDLDGDLHALKTYFDPVASGPRLRRELAKLVSAPVQALSLTSPVVLVIDKSRRIPTPEGRVALSVLRDALLRGDDPVLIADADVVDAERRLLDLYRNWSRHRISQVLALQSGSDKPLQIPAVGLLLALLANRVDDPARAVRLPDDPAQLRRVDRAFIEPADRFAQNLMPSLKHDASKESLRQGWWLGEITRRIPSAIEAAEDRVYIRPNGREQAIALAARELAGRPVDAAAVAEAFDKLVDGIRKRAGTLAGFDLAFERPSDTARLRQTLIDNYRAAAYERADATSGAA